MTQPNPEVAPGAPTPPTPAPGAPAPQPNPTPAPPGQDPNEPVDIANLPANVQKLITDLRKENGTHRTGRTAAEAAATQAQQQRDSVLKALGLNPDGSATTDPEAAAAQLAERAEAAEARAWTLGVKTAVYDLAGNLGANAKLVYASNDFRDTLDDLVDDDPETKEFKDALKTKIKDFVEANPEYKASAGQGPARIGVEHTGGNPGRQRAQGLGAAVQAAYRQQ